MTIHSGRSRRRNDLRRQRIRTGEQGSARPGSRRGPTHGNEVVVVVHEGAVSRGELVRLLRRLGYRAAGAANGTVAQRLAGRGRRIDLLLAEFSALGTSGVELVRWFSANRPETMVLVAADWLWEVEACLGGLPRVGVLAKEFTPGELARMVRAVLQESSRHGATGHEGREC